ncbi:MAG TPA: serine/threonine-protein kinase [Gemmatimonadales bacterium]|nr:serine/threonine-protein kinase [Gemmatimonadales bacterium]
MSFAEHLRLERELGRGGMATVYLARDLRRDEPVALKVLHPELAATLGPDRFRREIQLTARLDHPNVLPVLDSGVSGGRLWYTMPYIEGGSLRDCLQREGQLGIAESVRIAREVALALDHAHRCGVVHRDIKPENILVGAARVLVADFGIAKLLDVGDAGKLTGTGLSLGTPAYMSPEQAAGDARLDGRADVYALGCVLYEMLAGEPPFTGPTPQAILARHAMNAPPSLRIVRNTVGPALELAIVRAMAKVPADRFPSAGAFAAALDADWSIAPAAGPVPTTVVRARARRRWARLALLAAVGAGAIGWALLRPRGPLIAPSASVMAVLPFAPVGEDTALSRLGRDLASTVSANLDGVGDIRMVDRLTVLAQTHDRKGPLTLNDAGAIGRRYGATSVVVGSLARDGARVRLDVGLYSSDSLKPLARAIVTGSPDSLGALTDSITWRVLAEVWRRGKPPTPTLEAITTRSIEALRAYLDGEEASIAGRVADARAAYARAIAADSSFWYAYFRAGAAAGWYEEEADTAIVRVYRSHRDLLPRRERLLIDAWTWDSGLVWQRERLKDLVREYPDYWPAWFMLGDSYFHHFSYIGSTRADARYALERVVALNPRMVFGWDHLIWMYQADRDTAAAARALEALDRLDARDVILRESRADETLVWQIIQAVQTGSPAAQVLLDSLYDGAMAALASDGAVPEVYPWVLNSASPAIQIQFNRRLLQHGLPPDQSDGILEFTAMSWAARGAWDSALATVDLRRGTDPYDPPALTAYRLAVLGTWLGALPQNVAHARRPAAARWVDTMTSPLRPAFQSELAWLDGVLAFERRDARGLAAARAGVRAAGDSVAERARLVDLGPFELALRGNRREAAARLAALEWESADRDPWLATATHPLRRAINRLATMEWLLALGDTTQAARLLTWHQAFSWPLLEKIPVTPFADLQLARIEEARGQLDAARRDYQAFLVRYDMPPPAHRHLVQETREALARLSRGADPATDR